MTAHVTGMRSSSLELRQVSRSFGTVQALKPTDLDVPAGTLLALLGPSGCGKTTTLRIVAGFEQPDTGGVFLDGRDVVDLPPNKRQLGMVFQDYSLFPHMTVAENVTFGLRMQRLPREEIATRTRQILDLVRLSGFDARFPNQLSGGQQQRVALARSLVTSPLVLLLDEPLGALDKNLRENMQFELRRIQSELGITTVMVTHDQEEALTLADRVAVMNDGRVLQVGTPREVYDRPNSRFVSEFLGAANLFEGTVSAHGDAGRVAAEEARADLRVLRPGTLNERIVVGVRPEKTLILTETDEDRNALPATVHGKVFRGSYHAYELRLKASGKSILVYQQSQAPKGKAEYDLGEEVFVVWNTEHAFVFGA